VEAWFWAPEESCWAEAEISSLELATSSAAWRICRIMSFRLPDMPFREPTSWPTSSLDLEVRLAVRLPLAISWANPMACRRGLVMLPDD